MYRRNRTDLSQAIKSTVKYTNRYASLWIGQQGICSYGKIVDILVAANEYIVNTALGLKNGGLNPSITIMDSEGNVIRSDYTYTTGYLTDSGKYVVLMTAPNYSQVFNMEIVLDCDFKTKEIVRKDMEIDIENHPSPKISGIYYDIVNGNKKSKRWVKVFIEYTYIDRRLYIECDQLCDNGITRTRSLKYMATYRGSVFHKGVSAILGKINIRKESTALIKSFMAYVDACIAYDRKEK